MTAYEVHRLDELEAIRVGSADLTWRPVRRALGIRAFGINAYTAVEAGKHVVEEHTESALGHEEVYVVVSGRARFVLGEDEHDVDAGTIVYVRDPETKRAATALEPNTTVLAVGGKPGEAYQPSVWEWLFVAAPHHERGEYREGLAIVRDGLQQRPDHPAMYYYVAKYEALLGDRDGAVEHLARAIEGGERFRGFAREDEDFASLRDDPQFLALTREPDAGGPSA